MATTALITGASSGIGKAFAKRLAEEGHRLVLVARSQDKLEQLAVELTARYGVEAHVLAIDLSLSGSPGHVYAQTERLGITVDILINNAGFGLSGEFLNHSAEAYRQQIMLNISSVVELTHLFLPGMVARGRGSVVNVASLLSFFPFPYASVYSATKAFVLSFSESLWEEYRRSGIRVLAVCPGPTDTNFFATAKEVETRKKRTPEQVVQTAMKALQRNRSFVLDGTGNRLTALLGRLLPRRTVVKLFGTALRASIAKSKRQG